MNHDRHGFQTLGANCLQELTGYRQNMKALLIEHILSKWRAYVLGKPKDKMPFHTGSSQKGVTRLSCMFRQHEVVLPLIRVNFSHAYWNRWFRRDKCFWKNCTICTLFKPVTLCSLAQGILKLIKSLSCSQVFFCFLFFSFLYFTWKETLNV